MEKLILLIDDDQDELLILKQAIAMADFDFHCVWAENMERVGQVLTQWKPDYVFLDYNMPKTDGITCLQMIREMPSMKNIPIVIYSNHITEDTRRRAREKDATCIQKPDTIKKLVQCLHGLIQDGSNLHKQ